MLLTHPESTAPVVAIATRDQPLQAMDASGSNQQTPMINKVSAFSLEQQPNTYVLLGTAIVAIQGQTAKRENFRAIIDLGSQLNLMSRRMAINLLSPPSEHRKVFKELDNRSRDLRHGHVCCCHR